MPISIKLRFLMALCFFCLTPVVLAQAPAVQVTENPVVISPSLKLTQTNFSVGQKIEVLFTAPLTYLDAWVGIVPSSTPHGSEAVNDERDITKQYLKNQASGILTFTVLTAGSYDIRMNDTDNNGTEVASVSFKVKY